MLRLIIYRILIVSLLFLIGHTCYAQEKLEFSIVDFCIDQFSTAAQDKRYEKIDGDGNRYAIIKVKDVEGEGNLEGFTFNFGALNSIVETHDEELWVYVQRNAKTVTIKRPGYKTIERYNLNATILPGKVYEMRITMSRVRKVIEHDITKQILQFVVTPSNEHAIVKVKKTGSSSDFELWGEVDETGSIDKIMDFGSYDYMVSAVNYVSSTGRISLADSKKTYVERVLLKPDFGYLVVDDAHGISGAQLFIDDVKIGTVPYRDSNKRWSCGTHKITITNGDLYKTYNSTFTIQQGDTTHLSPKLESDFAQTTIKVDADAEIFIDGKSKGLRTWAGPLKAGKYIVECKQEKHKPTSLSINVKADKAETFVIPSPVAITGSVYVRSNPSGATIDIDGVEYGSTPKLIHDLIIGQHSVKLTMPNHKAEQYNIYIKEGETENIDGVLSDIAHMTIDSKPSNAKLFINGENVGMTPYSNDMSSGDYDIEIQHKKFQTFKDKVHLDSSNPSVTITLARQYQRPYCFYVQPFMQVGSNMAVGGAVGAYIANVNFECSYGFGLKQSKLYWNNIIDENLKPELETFSFNYLSSNIGYGFILKNRFRVTPRIGFSIALLKGDKETKCNAVGGTIGCTLDYVIFNHVSVNVMPQYTKIISQSDTYKRLTHNSSVIEGMAGGFNCSLGAKVFF